MILTYIDSYLVLMIIIILNIIIINLVHSNNKQHVNMNVYYPPGTPWR